MIEDAIASGSRRSTTKSRKQSDCQAYLPNNYFQSPVLSEHETSYLTILAKRACKEVVYYSRATQGPIEWVPTGTEHNDVQVYEGVDRSMESNTNKKQSHTYLRGVTRVHATIDEIADFFKLDTPEKLQGYKRIMANDILDEQTLYTLACSTAENPNHYVGVKWSAMQIPGRLLRNRDFCYLECRDEFMDTTGNRRGWARSLHSIQLPCCPSLESSHNLVRASICRSGFVFLELQGCSNVVEVIQTLHMDLHGNAPSRLKLQVMRRQIGNLSALSQYFYMQKNRMPGDVLIDLDTSVCQYCGMKFGFFHRKWRCRKCGSRVCTQCREDLVSSDVLRLKKSKIRACKLCCLPGNRADSLPILSNDSRHCGESAIKEQITEKSMIELKKGVSSRGKKSLSRSYHQLHAGRSGEYKELEIKSAEDGRTALLEPQSKRGTQRVPDESEYEQPQDCRPSSFRFTKSGVAKSPEPKTPLPIPGTQGFFTWQDPDIRHDVPLSRKGSFSEDISILGASSKHEVAPEMISDQDALFKTFHFDRGTEARRLHNKQLPHSSAKKLAQSCSNVSMSRKSTRTPRQSPRLYNDGDTTPGPFHSAAANLTRQSTIELLPFIKAEKSAQLKVQTNDDLISDHIASQAFALHEASIMAKQLAQSAIQMYERENKTDLRITAAARELALDKMVELYKKKLMEEQQANRVDLSKTMPINRRQGPDQYPTNSTVGPCAAIRRTLDMADLESVCDEDKDTVITYESKHTDPSTRNTFARSLASLRPQTQTLHQAKRQSQNSDSDLMKKLPTKNLPKPEIDVSALDSALQYQNLLSITHERFSDSEFSSNTSTGSCPRWTSTLKDDEDLQALTNSDSRTDSKTNSNASNALQVEMSNESQESPNTCIHSDTNASLSKMTISQRELNELRKSLVELMSEYVVV